MAVFGLSVENRVGEGVSSFLLEDVCLRVGVDPWGLALCLFLGFCRVGCICFWECLTMIELVSLLDCVDIRIGDSMQLFFVVIVSGSFSSCQFWT